MKILQFY